MIEFDLEEFNVFEVGGRTYFVVETAPGRIAVLPDACPHRGGPLRLGRYDANRCALVCPWHATAFPVARLARRALPAARRGHRVATCVPAGAEAAITFRRQSAVVGTLY